MGKGRGCKREENGVLRRGGLVERGWTRRVGVESSRRGVLLVQG
jgi:hypothetical protein